MNNYFTSFRLLTHLGVKNISATGVLSKKRLRKYTVVTDKQPQKREYDRLQQRAPSKKKQCKFDSGWFERQQRGVHSFF